MKKVYFIKNPQPKLPIVTTLVAYLSLDKFNAPEWLWGVIGFIMLIYWILQICLMVVSKGISIQDLFNEDSLKRSKFLERMEQIAKERSK